MNTPDHTTDPTPRPAADPHNPHDALSDEARIRRAKEIAKRFANDDAHKTDRPEQAPSARHSAEKGKGNAPTQETDH